MQMIDMHCHVLSGIDDGAASLEMSCEMLHLAWKQGVRAVIATPHDSLTYRCEPEQIRSLCRKTEQKYYRLYGNKVAVYPGQEVFYRDSVIQELQEGKLLTMADSSYVLVEFLPGTPFSAIFTAARMFRSSGYRMILAHAERYHCIRSENYLEQLLNTGVYIQLNARTIGGKWFDEDTRWCRKLLKEGKVHFVASDMHNLDSRKPEFQKAAEWMQRHLDERYVEAICWQNTVNVINDKKV